MVSNRYNWQLNLRAISHEQFFQQPQKRVKRENRKVQLKFMVDRNRISRNDTRRRSKISGREKNI